MGLGSPDRNQLAHKRSSILNMHLSKEDGDKASVGGGSIVSVGRSSIVRRSLVVRKSIREHNLEKAPAADPAVSYFGIDIKKLLNLVYDSSVETYERKTRVLETQGQLAHLKANLLFRRQNEKSAATLMPIYHHTEEAPRKTYEMHVADVIKDLERKGSLRTDRERMSFDDFKDDLLDDGEMSEFFAHLSKRADSINEPFSPVKLGANLKVGQVKTSQKPSAATNNTSKSPVGGKNRRDKNARKSPPATKQVGNKLDKFFHKKATMRDEKPSFERH